MDSGVPAEWGSVPRVEKAETVMILFAKVWALGYALTILGVALGLVVICRPSSRKASKKRFSQQ